VIAASLASVPPSSPQAGFGQQPHTAVHGCPHGGGAAHPTFAQFTASGAPSEAPSEVEPSWVELGVEPSSRSIGTALTDSHALAVTIEAKSAAE
jgi:hypothetical protein